jgi:LacI family transcriptional regulator
MGWYDYRVHEGISRFAVEHNWHLCPDATKEKVIPWGWEGDGILAWLGAGDDLAEFVVGAGKPTVDFSLRRSNLQFPRVLVDHAAAARLAADYYLSRGFTQFMFYSQVKNWGWDEDGEAFVQAITEAGRQCRWACWERSPRYCSGRQEWRRRRQWLASELKKLPKPLAVLAANDDQAMDVLESCESLGLMVPEEVSIIGMENSLLAAEAMTTPVSSIDTNLEGLGYQGAALLADMMNGLPAPQEPVRVPIVGLVARRSSDYIAVNHPGIERSLRFLSEHYREPITVKDLAKAAAMSVRGFHKTFQQHVNRSPGQQLRQVRIEAAKTLLVKSDEKISAIAAMCGFQSANGFWSAFRQATGLSPNRYREENGRVLPGK